MNDNHTERQFKFWALVGAAFPGTEVVHEINLIGTDALAVVCSTAPILLEHGVKLKAIEARMEAGAGVVNYRIGARDDAALANLLLRLEAIGVVKECSISSFAGRVAEQ
ncbi:hypothetical protein I3J27_27610 [Bradyrhizobium xenonodulans]|uniref:Uncharacterized protein n=1 Tax=Bradyrhizobium xenonodulans TaxID=2736875 RepID=A0ABY7MGQ5_9BRAD|nr:hypothetical protein [Bradyrhizobium xenonodulans]WBL76766.1 hypothetical protein I3J27_27610 [Bradyrhizobium xenonodulans]